MVECYPTFYLKNEHLSILGQLDLLEASNGGKSEDMLSVLQALDRDCEIHFRHEHLLLHALSSNLESGGHQLKSLIAEHKSLEREVEGLLAMLREGEPRGLIGVHDRLRIRIQDFIKTFRANIRHEERVVYLLAETRLTPDQLRIISQKMLAL